MQKLHFDIEIDAPVAKVWDTMLEDAPYRDWSAAFMEGSHYVGDWNEGSRILFLAPGEEGPAGMVSRVRENRRHEFVSLEHIGVVSNGREDTASEAARAWAGAREEYTFRDLGERTVVQVEMDSDGEHVEMLQSMWPRALQRLKELAEA